MIIDGKQYLQYPLTFPFLKHLQAIDSSFPTITKLLEVHCADMKILQYIRLHIKNSIMQIAHYNNFHFSRYTHLRYAKGSFPNIQKQQKRLKNSLPFKKNTNFTGEQLENSQDSECVSGYYFYMNTNLWNEFQVCISVPLSNKIVQTFCEGLK